MDANVTGVTGEMNRVPSCPRNSGEPMLAVVTGAVASERRLSVCVASTLPTLSMVQKLTVWLPSAKVKAEV